MVLTSTQVPLPQERIAHRVFESHAARHPERLALTCGEERLTYGQLNARANQVAHYLASIGVARGSVVGVCIDRSSELVATILGVLKAGAAYVPLDPSYPHERLRLMISQLPRMNVVAVGADTLPLVAGAPGKVVDMGDPALGLGAFPATAPSVEIDSSDLCYVVFTSGSTGTPKATAVRHEGWYNLLNWLTLEYSLDHESGNLLVSSFGFDISQRSLMTPLFTGAPLHLLPSRSFDVSLAYRLIGELGVRTLHCAPSTLYLLVEREMDRGTEVLTGLRYVFIGGEPMSAARVAEWATREGNQCLLLHQYGVAECTDVASSHRMVDYESYAEGPMPAGSPVYNTEIHILDGDLQKVPDGEVGEICISGISVGAGYLNAGPEAQARFVTVQRDGGDVRLYRTGDQGYTTESGELVVVGRLDHQVKIRGMRIDLGDVEHAVRRHQDVRDAVVVPVGSGREDTRLVALVIPARDRFDERALRRDLLDTVPRNMVPQQFVALEAFPLNPNGKVDRKALAGRLRSGSPTAGSGAR
ncbi:amino acid adenylation domain-containing protein [Streptantibioticus ferralitis]|uniref:Amino acid adenylation domain-containing protein n=1 Tax=Streptantibioticus ferralitis TaxID=236510 RepID=A0ABT5YV79_9ACTN|nr:amino acid adenylation domain-containing protein [Streptantibioticus ferralitis]MDF2255517.1 amino acid adenylation domain-containing protein [Streptantibioticus ferralitis]